MIFLWDEQYGQGVVLNIDRMSHATYDGDELRVRFGREHSVVSKGREARRVWELIMAALPDTQSSAIEKIEGMKYSAGAGAEIDFKSSGKKQDSAKLDRY